MTIDIDALKKTSVYAEESFVVDTQSFLEGLMEDKGMSRAQLAAAMGVSRARVTQLFSSECKNFTIRLLARALFALGETAELTCEHQRKQQKRAGRREIMFADEVWLSSKYSFENAGAVNDNRLHEGSAFNDVEVASAPNDPRVNHLVSTLGRALLRERAIA